jgi:hypothetical protein
MCFLTFSVAKIQPKFKKNHLKKPSEKPSEKIIWSSSQKCRRIFFKKLLSYLACGQVFRTCHNFFCLVCGPLQIFNYWIYGIKVWCYWQHPCGTHLKPGEYHRELVGEHGGNKILRRIMRLDPSQKEIRWAFLSACAVGLNWLHANKALDHLISSMEIYTKAISMVACKF